LDLGGEILQAKDVSKSFGGIRAVDNCSIEIEEGSIVGLIGPNGAGKSTLFELISGFQRPDSGRISFMGKDITGIPAHRIAQMGLVRTFQIPRALTRMTVLENMMLGTENQSGENIFNALIFRNKVKKEEKAIEERALSILELFDILRMKDEYAGTLSGGQKKLLEMARSLMAEPKMLLLDEPFAGVNPSLSRKLIERIKELKSDGLTMLIIEHGIPYVMELSDQVYVLNKGSVMASGSPDEVISDRRVLDAYLGGDAIC
jgi:ABC-type branched-subunit amino acid transport system ATPase component